MPRSRTLPGPAEPDADDLSDHRDARTDDRDGRRPRRSPALRLLRALVVLAVVLGLAFYAGGGWYFAGEIESQALAVAPESSVDTLTLTPLGNGRVAVRADDAADRARLDAGSTYGLAWEGGYGQLTGPAEPGGPGTVVRHLTMLAGGSPVAGTRAHLDVDAFPHEPARVFPQAREVGVTSGSHTLPAWFAPGRDGTRAGTTTGTWAVLVHGKGDDRAAMLRLMRDTVAAGLPSLAISYRNDVGAPRDPSGYYQYGRTEWRDLAAAVDHARTQGADHVVLVGYSMGGAIVASYLRHRPDGLPVRAVVLDAPLLDLTSTVRYGARQTPLPLLGHVPDSLTWAAARVATLRFGVDWAASDYLTDTSWLRVPALVLHGVEDATVPLATSERLRDRAPGRVRLVRFPDAGHVESWNVDPARYDAAVRGFLRGL